MSDSSPSSSRLPLVAGALAVVAVVVLAIVFLFGGEDPDEVDAASALEQAEAAGDDAGDDDASGEAVDEETDEPTTGDATAAEPDDEATTGNVASAAEEPPAGLDGTWTVDTEAVDYSFADNTGTFVGFRIDEELSTIGETQAVGRTPAVTGELTLEGTTVAAATFTGDAAALTTDRSQRDNRARQALGDGILAFTLTSPIELPAPPSPGDTFTVDATGELLVNGVTQTYTVPLSASLSTSGLLALTSAFAVSLGDHDVTAPRAGPVLSVSDVATVEVQLFLTR